MKYLPWERCWSKTFGNFTRRYQRLGLGTNRIMAEVQLNIVNWKYYNDIDDEGYGSFEEASKSEDKYLIKNGFYLIRPEELDRFKNKLQVLL